MYIIQINFNCMSDQRAGFLVVLLIIIHDSTPWQPKEIALKSIRPIFRQKEYVVVISVSPI